VNRLRAYQFIPSLDPENGCEFHHNAFPRTRGTDGIKIEFAFLKTCRLTCNHSVAYVRLMDAVFKALADPSRRKLLDELRKENGQTLSELCEHLDMTRQAVTKHLVLLEKANLIAVVWRGREKLHYLNPMPLHEIYERWIGKYERHRLQALSDLKKGLEQTKIKKLKRK
jgi:DNA-binding transcriptional ArsR family regulator